MKRFRLRRLIIALSAFAPALLLSEAARAEPIVLVHGANLRESSWNEVRDDLARAHFIVAAPALYAADEKADLREVSTRLCAALKRLGKPAILVGHSQGGAIITEAAALCPERVTRLVYVAAVFPKPGEGVFDDLSQIDNDRYSSCGRLDAKSGTYELKGLEGCAGVFMNGLSASVAKKDYAHFAAEPAAIGDSKAAYDWEIIKGIPKYYVETKKDLIIGPETQRKIVGKARFEAVYSIDTGHTPFFARPVELSGLLKAIAIGK